MNARLRRNRWLLLFLALVLVAVVGIARWAVWVPRIPPGAMVVPRDVPTLQQALESASPGDVIVLLPTIGSIEGPLTIGVPKVTVTSLYGRIPLVSQEDGPALTVAADGVTVRGLALQSVGVGVRVLGSDCRLIDLQVDAAVCGIQVLGADRCEIDTVRLHGGAIGLEVHGAWSLRVRQSTIAQTSQYGVHLRRSRHALLHDVEVVDTPIGVSIEGGSDHATLLQMKLTRCTDHAITVSDSASVSLQGLEIHTAGAGIVVEDARDVSITDCVIRGVDTVGVTFKRTTHGRIQGCTLEGCGDRGILISEGEENAVTGNRVDRCEAIGIHLVQTRKALLQANSISQGEEGIRVESSRSVRILRQRVEEVRFVGILLLRGEGHQVLDSAVAEGAYGIALISSHSNSVVRNTVTRATKAGLVLAVPSGENLIAENVVTACRWGLLGLSPTEGRIQHNELAGHEIGMLLMQPGGALQVDGNSLARNGVGLKLQPEISLVTEDLLGWDVAGPVDLPAAALRITNNAFQQNSVLDIENLGPLSVVAGGNWWGPERSRDATLARVSDRVSLQQSPRERTVVVGGGAGTSSLLLGAALSQELTGAGYRVIDLVGMESGCRVQHALAVGDLDLAWCREILSCREETPVERDAVKVFATNVLSSWRLVVSAELAAQLAAPTISALAVFCEDMTQRLRCATVASMPEDLLHQSLLAASLAPWLEPVARMATLAEVETMMKLGMLDAAIVPGLEETLSFSGLVRLEDDLQAFAPWPVSILVRQATLETHADLEPILANLSERLTTEDLHAMVSQVRLLRRRVEDVARALGDLTE